MADSTKGTEEKGLGEQEQSLAVVVAPEPMVPPEGSSNSDVADEDDEYSSPTDPCPSPSPKRRKKDDGEEGDKDYIPPKKGFPDGSEAAVRNCALQTMAKSWRGWKTTLNKKFVKTGRTPFSTYANITPNQWDDFLTLKNSPEEIQRSQKYAKLAKKNEFPHRLGSAGYAPKVEQWTKEEEEMRKKGQPVPMEEWTQRSRNWVRARTPKITDEGKVSFEDPELQSVSDKIENLSSSQKKGFFKPKTEKDVLSTALGTLEHGGRVRDVSSKMSWKEGFKNDPHKKREVYKDKLRDEGATEFERQMMDFYVKHMILPRPETKEPEPDYPFDDLKENTLCRLHVPIGCSGKTLEAATAIAIPRRTYNEEFIPDAYAKVQPQVVHEGFESYDIDFLTADGVSVLGDAVDLVILWHKNDISFGLGTDATQKPVVPKPGLGKPPRPPKRKVTDQAEELEMQKENPVLKVPPEIAVPEAVMEIPVSDVPMEIIVAEPEVQFVASVGSEIEEVPGLEWDGTGPEIFEDPSPAKDPEVQETTVPEKATTSSEVPRVLRSHDSKSKDENKEKFMVTVFRGGKERAKLRDDDPQKAVELAEPTYFATDDCPEKMQYVDAKKKKVPIGFLDPTQICQTQHTVRLAPRSDQLKGKNPKEIAEYKKGLRKEKLITVAQYIGRAFLHFQNKRVIMAAYNFNDHYICLLIHPKDGTVVVLDPLDYRHQSYKEFLTILQYAYQYYKFKGGEQTQTREKLLCHKQPRGTVLCRYYTCEFLRVNERYRTNAEDLPRLERRTSFDDTGITNVQRDLCHFIHHECCHVKGDFFDPESALATSDEFKDLREWNSAMP
uniref:Transposon protein, putative, CACTA, En/Spm sub-class n=1 Tax=Oryza sativa subsp. japonica TaxID=39947 RepID=Q10FJ9_ORYSJ|nr:transposon protein, putative, CACTA, En/Spm sub-class [Oryza sativa Japonica Group]